MTLDLNLLQGIWSGGKALYLPWMDPAEQQCDCSLSVDVAAAGKALVLRYAWTYEQRPQHGVLLLTRDMESGIATAAWLDSWHQGRQLLTLEGRWEGDVADVLGQYAVDNSPPWGWRMLVTLGAAQVRVQMFNRSPAGEESPAVDLIWVPSAA